MKTMWAELSSTLCYSAKRMFNLLPALLTIVNPFVTMLIALHLYSKRGSICMQMFITPLVLLLITYFITVIKQAVALERFGMPIARKRFTRRDENGHIDFKMTDLVEMIEYLATIEEYCDKHGLYHRVRNTSLLIAFFACLIFTPSLSAQAKECIEYERVTCTLTAEEEVLIQQIALAEAENQGIGGMAFVMQVILNRIQSDEFPDTLEEVVSQENQFSVYASGAYIEKEPNDNSKKALELLSVLQNKNALYFENPRGKDDTWHSRNLEYVFEYGDHVFYK